MNTLTKKIMALAATAAASTAVFASTVGTETATAATFYGGFQGEEEARAEVSSESAETLFEFLEELQNKEEKEKRKKWVWLVRVLEKGLVLEGSWLWRSEYYYVGEAWTWERYELGRWVFSKESLIEITFDQDSSWCWREGEWNGCWREGEWKEQASVPEPSSAIALGALGVGLVASRLRRRSKKTKH